MYYYGPNMMNGNDWGWGIFMMFFWLLLLVIGAIVVIRLLSSHEVGHNHRTAPLDIAKERYAKGEVTKEQFEQLKKDLK